MKPVASTRSRSTDVTDPVQAGPSDSYKTAEPISDILCRYVDQRALPISGFEIHRDDQRRSR